MAGNYYDREFDPWVNGIRNIGTMIMQQPALRAQAQERAQHAALYNAEIGTQGARADLYRSQTGKTQAETDELMQGTAGERKMAGALRTLTATPNDPNALADLFAGVAMGFRKNPDQTAKGIGAVLGQLNILKTGQAAVPTAAALTDPTKVYSDDQHLVGVKYGDDLRAQTAGNRPLIIPREGSAIDPKTGKVIGRGMVDLGPGHELFVPPDLAPQAPDNAPTGSLLDKEDAPIDADSLYGQVSQAVPIRTGSPAPSFAKVASGTPLPPHSAAGDVANQRIVADLIKKYTNADGKLDTVAFQQAMGQYRWATGNTNAPASSATDPMRIQAQAAIAKGKDPAQVQRRFKQLTGEDL
jgi:hypothetical protein